MWWPINCASGRINAPPQPVKTAYFGTEPSHATYLPRSDSFCTLAVTPNAWEPRPDNDQANHTIVSAPYGWSIENYWTRWRDKRARVTGNFTGTTAEIIQWAACKWGIDEDTMRAAAVQESYWHMSTDRRCMWATRRGLLRPSPDQKRGLLGHHYSGGLPTHDAVNGIECRLVRCPYPLLLRRRLLRRWELALPRYYGRPDRCTEWVEQRFLDMHRLPLLGQLVARSALRVASATSSSQQDVGDLRLLALHIPRCAIATNQPKSSRADFRATIFFVSHFWTLPSRLSFAALLSFPCAAKSL